MGFFDGLLYRSEPLAHRSAPDLSGWYRPSSPAPTSSMLTNWPGQPLTASLAVPTIFRSVSMISTKVGKFTPLADRAGEQLADQPAMLADPDPLGSTAYDFYSATATGMLLGPCAFWLHTRDATGRVVRAEVVPSADVSTAWLDTARTRRIYHVANRGTFHQSGTIEGLAAGQDMVHIPYMHLPGSLLGVHPLGVARTVVEAQLSADALARSNFQDGAFPSGKLTVKSALSEIAAQKLKNQFVRATSGTREPVILTGDQDFEPLAVVAKDAQWIESRRWTAGDLARLFGVRAGALDLPVEGGGNLTYTNVREVRTDVLIEAIDPVLCPIGAVIQRHWMPHGVRINQWDTSSYLPPVEAVEHSPMDGSPVVRPANEVPAS